MFTNGLLRTVPGPRGRSQAKEGRGWCPYSSQCRLLQSSVGDGHDLSHCHQESSCILVLATFGKVSGKNLQGKALGLVEGRTRSLVVGFGVEGSCVYI